MGQERRRVPRFPFDGTADVIVESSGAKTSARMREISLYGCRLVTATPLPAKTRVLVRIFGPAEFIEAAATVVFANLDLGTGLAFRKIETEFQYILKRWLLHALERDLA
jgi:PilZ domain